jgi:hypothetical protein
MTATLRSLSEQFKTYDQALEEFVGKNNPVPIRNFLFAASAAFWRLGQGITAALNAAAIVEDTQKPGSSSKFEGVVEVLMRLRVALSDRASSHAL